MAEPGKESMRAPFQVLVIPFQKSDKGFKFYLFKRSDEQYWQGISGGGEDDETPLQAAIRETQEEAGIPHHTNFIQLSSVCSIPVTGISGFRWGPEVLVVPEYAFGVAVPQGAAIKLSHEHTDVAVAGFEEAMKLLKWDSNKTALWELNHRLQQGLYQFI